MTKKEKIEKRKTLFQKNVVPFSKKNFIILAIGFVLILIGYYLMAIGEVDSFIAVTLAPIILFIAYVVLIPYAILKRFKNEKD